MARNTQKGRFGASIFALLVAAVDLALVLTLRTQDDVTVVLSSWRSSLLAESAVRLGSNSWLWPLALILALSTFCLLLADLGHRQSAFPSSAPIPLALLAGALAAIWSANPLTTILSWALYDLLVMLGQVGAGGRSRDIARRLAFGSISLLLLWAGVLVAGNGTGSVQWSLTPPGGAKMTLWMLAGLLRLGVYPFHSPTLTGLDAPSPSIAAFLLGPALGWALWIRLIRVSGTLLAENTWIIIPALLTLAVGGFVGWAVRSPDEGRPWIGMGIHGSLLLAIALVSLPGASQGPGEDTVLSTLALGAAACMLGGTVLFLGGGFGPRSSLRRDTWPRTIPSLLAALSLIGLPPTLGFAVASSLIKGLTRVGHWGWGIGFFIGQLFLVAAVTRWLFPTASPPQTDEEDDRPVRQTAHYAAVVAAALPLVVLGLAPTLLVAGPSSVSLRSLLAGLGSTGWLLWGGSLLLGGILGWQDTYLRPRLSVWLDLLQDIIRLDWAWALLSGAFAHGLTVLRAIDDVLGGKGALLWSLILLLLLILIWRGT
ncbi:MAG: hypothetical protein PVG25_11400 [Anaerolineae bacterium]